MYESIKRATALPVSLKSNLKRELTNFSSLMSEMPQMFLIFSKVHLKYFRISERNQTHFKN